MVGVDRIRCFWERSKRAGGFERGDKRSDGENWACECRWIGQDARTWCVGIGGCEGGAMMIDLSIFFCGWCVGGISAFVFMSAQ